MLPGDSPALLYDSLFAASDLPHFFETQKDRQKLTHLDCPEEYINIKHVFVLCNFLSTSATYPIVITTKILFVKNVTGFDYACLRYQGKILEYGRLIW